MDAGPEGPQEDNRSHGGTSNEGEGEEEEELMDLPMAVRRSNE